MPCLRRHLRCPRRAKSKFLESVKVAQDSQGPASCVFSSRERLGLRGQGLRKRLPRGWAPIQSIALEIERERNKETAFAQSNRQSQMRTIASREC